MQFQIGRCRTQHPGTSAMPGVGRVVEHKRAAAGRFDLGVVHNSRCDGTMSVNTVSTVVSNRAALDDTVVQSDILSYVRVPRTGDVQHPGRPGCADGANIEKVAADGERTVLGDQLAVAIAVDLGTDLRESASLHPPCHRLR